MRKFLVAAALIGAASPGVAADFFMDGPPAAPPPLYDYGYDSGWTGQYLGVTAGGQRTRIDIPNNGVLEGYNLIGGVFAGVNFQEENGLVLGAEADAEYVGFDQTVACGNPTWSCRGYVSVQGSLRARLGYSFDDFLVYATAGLAAAHVGGSTTSPTDVVYPDSHIRVGWTVGAGAEFAFSDAWFARAEYRYTDLGSRDMSFDVAYPGVGATSHAVKAGLGYRF